MIFLIVILLFQLIIFVGTTQQSDADALCGFKAGITNWKTGAVVGCSACIGWSCSGTTATSVPCGTGSTTWTGVGCSGNTVTSITLSSKQLQGTIASSLFSIATITSIDLNTNSLFCK